MEFLIFLWCFLLFGTLGHFEFKITNSKVKNKYIYPIYIYYIALYRQKKYQSVPSVPTSPLSLLFSPNHSKKVSLKVSNEVSQISKCPNSFLNSLLPSITSHIYTTLTFSLFHVSLPDDSNNPYHKI